MEVMAETGRKEAKMYPFFQSPGFNAMFLLTDYQGASRISRIAEMGNKADS